jgi:hypothetical protein
MTELPPLEPIIKLANERSGNLSFGVGIKDKFPALEIAFPVSSSEIPCSDAQGISIGSVDFSGSLQGCNASGGRFSANFPVFFPVTGKFDADVMDCVASQRFLISENIVLLASKGHQTRPFRARTDLQCSVFPPISAGAG